MVVISSNRQTIRNPLIRHFSEADLKRKISPCGTLQR